MHSFFWNGAKRLRMQRHTMSPSVIFLYLSKCLSRLYTFLGGFASSIIGQGNTYSKRQMRFSGGRTRMEKRTRVCSKEHHEAAFLTSYRKRSHQKSTFPPESMSCPLESRDPFIAERWTSSKGQFLHPCSGHFHAFPRVLPIRDLGPSSGCSLVAENGPAC